MLSDAQEGSRPHHNTHRQLQTLMGVIEDAHLHRSPLFILYLDFSAAYSSVPHDGLLRIMGYLGFPADAVAAVEDIYTHATTIVRTPYGDAPEVHIRRGTLQGDTLSPLLFLLFLEPLLRWLDVGERGYRVTSALEPCRVASAAFVDDVALAAGTAEDAKRQLHKVHRFGEWAGIKLNIPKCAITHLRFGAGASPLPLKRASAAMRRVTLPAVGAAPGAHLPLLGPHDTYRYLGIHLSGCFDTCDELAAMRKIIRREDAACQVD